MFAEYRDRPSNAEPHPGVDIRHSFNPIGFGLSIDIDLPIMEILLTQLVFARLPYSIKRGLQELYIWIPLLRTTVGKVKTYVRCH